jgi:hypothetical protein
MSIITNFNTFGQSDEIREEEETPTPAPEPAEPKAEEAPAEPAPTETPAPEATQTPEETEHTYAFTWYGWVPSYRDFDQDWLEVKAKSDADAIKKFKESPSAKFTDGASLDSLDGERPKGASHEFEKQEDGSKIFKSVEVDMEGDKFILKVTKYPAGYFTEPAPGKKEITKEDIEPFFGAAETKPEETQEKPVEEQPAPEPAEESKHEEIGNLKEKFEMVCDELRKTSLKCKATLTERDIIIELGYDYPDELAGTIWQVMDKCGVGSRQFSICAESHGHKAIKVIHINGGPQDWSMVNRYGRR